MKNDYIPMRGLQLFTEGAGDGGTAQGQGVTAAAAVPQTQGEKSDSSADVRQGIAGDRAPAAEVPTATPDRNALFEQLIKGEYKDLYDAKVQHTIQKRLKATRETVDKFNALAPALALLESKYGVAAGDTEALGKAIQADDAYYQQEAEQREMTVSQLREVKRIEGENARLKAQMQEAQRQETGRKLVSAWLQQAQETGKIYPAFDLRAEMGNPRFVELLRSNIDVRTAYEVTHKDEIIAGAMEFTAKAVESKLAKSMAASGARPSENGMRSQSAAVVKSDVSQLTKADRAEIIRRVQRGEKIRF